MCGISGIIDFKKKLTNPLEKIISLNLFNKRRGPDDEGIWVDNEKKVFLGHRRLSIIDLSKNGHQPFISNEGKISLVFNGEIYNFKELKKILIEKNYKFKSKTDTEVILYSYIEWGIECVHKFRGMFAIAIWDDNIKKLHLIRDPFGIKPLYYFKNNDLFYFSSSIKSLITCEVISKKKSNTSLINYMLWGNTVDPDTIYEEILSVEKGQYITLNQNMNLEKKKYYNLMENIQNIEPGSFKNINEAREYLKEIIKETVNYHLISDVNTGIALSSGLDSNLILANINNKYINNVESLTVDFNIDGTVQDELKIAKQHAFKKSINNKSLNLNQIDIKKELSFFHTNMDTPTNDGFNTLVLSKLAKKNNIKVLLTGIGADEIFMGYPTFKRASKYLYILKLLSKLNFNNSPKKIVLFLSNFFNYNPKYSEIFNIKNPIDIYTLSRRLFVDAEIKEILFEKEKEFNGRKLSTRINQPNLDSLNTNAQLMFLEMEYYLCPKLLKDTDWTSMAYSIEVRTPFVDSVFFNKYLRLFKSKFKIDKKFIYETFKDVLPSALASRKKSGFGIPHEYLNKQLNTKNRFKSNLKEWSMNNLNQYLN